MSYAIGNLILGWDLGDMLESQVLCTYKNLIEIQEDSTTPGFHVSYSSGCDKPCWIGLSLFEMNECTTVQAGDILNPISNILSSNHHKIRQVMEAKDKFIQELSDAWSDDPIPVEDDGFLSMADIMKELDSPPDLMIVWSSS